MLKSSQANFFFFWLTRILTEMFIFFYNRDTHNSQYSKEKDIKITIYISLLLKIYIRKEIMKKIIIIFNNWIISILTKSTKQRGLLNIY